MQSRQICGIKREKQTEPAVSQSDTRDATDESLARVVDSPNGGTTTVDPKTKSGAATADLFDDSSSCTLAVEQTEMIKGKRLRALAVVADQPLTIEGIGTIEPITKTLPKFPKITTAFGIFIPKGVPPEVVTTMDRIWGERVAKSEKIKQYAQQKGALFTPASGKQAYDIVWPTVVEDAYMLQEAGMAKVPPESIGIKR